MWCTANYARSRAARAFQEGSTRYHQQEQRQYFYQWSRWKNSEKNNNNNDAASTTDKTQGKWGINDARHCIQTHQHPPEYTEWVCLHRYLTASTWGSSFDVSRRLKLCGFDSSLTPVRKIELLYLPRFLKLTPQYSDGGFCKQHNILSRVLSKTYNKARPRINRSNDEPHKE